MPIIEKIPSNLELVPDLTGRFIEKLRAYSFSTDDIFKIKVSLEEALTNAVRHGNKSNPDLFVMITLITDKDKIVFKVQDEGAGFDFSHIPDPTVKDNSAKPSGRGLYIMKGFMDEVRFFDNGCCVEMVKYFKYHD